MTLTDAAVREEAERLAGPHKNCVVHNPAFACICGQALRVKAIEAALARARKEALEEAAKQSCSFCRGPFAPAAYDAAAKLWVHPHPNGGWPGWVCIGSWLRALAAEGAGEGKA